jgi:[NiFe] hydrogenase diaphorase moiety large subunit
MEKNLRELVEEAAVRVGRDRTRLMDVVRDVQARYGGVPAEAIDRIAEELGVPRVDVEGVVTFYAFLSKEPRGRHVIRLSTCPACRGPHGYRTADALERELGIRFGEVTADGAIGLEHTACIGLCDQGPAALVTGIGGRPIARLTPDRVKELVRAIREGTLREAGGFDDVRDSIRQAGDVILTPMVAGAGLRRARAMTPEQVIAEVKAAMLRGRGGAGFPTGTKWEFARRAPGVRKVVICNADEGEPGTFKDRVILHEVPETLFEGMAVAGYAIGASEGILYLRGEYEWLKDPLERTLRNLRRKGVLGENAGGKPGFFFDIRIQLGAGAYVCGEESALISSLEGKRGEPKNRPPFPVERGYLGLPTAVNNVETYCCVARILEKGAPWFASFGTRQSTGTKVFSVSGDCTRPGVYELPFGLTLREFLARVGGEHAAAVLVGGPSGTFLGPASFDRKLGFEDLATGGSMMVFGPGQDLLEVVSDFLAFFVEESCGWCTPCRVGNVLLKERVDRIRLGQGVPEDLAYLEELATTVRKTSRCGLGQSSPNPVLTTLQHFRHLYEARLRHPRDGGVPSFDLDEALGEAVRVQGRRPIPPEEQR